MSLDTKSRVGTSWRRRPTEFDRRINLVLTLSVVAGRQSGFLPSPELLKNAGLNLVRHARRVGVGRRTNPIHALINLFSFSKKTVEGVLQQNHIWDLLVYH